MTTKLTNAALLRELDRLNAELAKAKEAKSEDDFQPVWRKEGKDWASNIVQVDKEALEAALEHDGKLWLNIFPNRYWEKKKKVAKERPMMKVTFHKYTPKS
jgi:hypothetical protein